MIDRVARAQGCLLGQLAGDALGSLAAFQSPDEIRRSYPEGVRELANGGTWNTIIAGQPTKGVVKGSPYPIRGMCGIPNIILHARIIFFHRLCAPEG